VIGPTFTVAPSILGFTPVDAAPGATITLTGSGLANVVTVTFGGGAATAPATTGTNSLTVVVPAAAATGPLTASDGTHASTSDDIFAVD
jgi:IPT/TIG domain